MHRWQLQFSYMEKQNQTDKGIQKEQRIRNPLRSKRLFTLKEAAEYLGRSEWGMRDLMWKRKIPVVKEPEDRKVYFDIYDLESYIEKNKSLYK